MNHHSDFFVWLGIRKCRVTLLYFSMACNNIYQRTHRFLLCPPPLSQCSWRTKATIGRTSFDVFPFGQWPSERPNRKTLLIFVDAALKRSNLSPMTKCNWHGFRLSAAKRTCSAKSKVIWISDVLGFALARSHIDVQTSKSRAACFRSTNFATIRWWRVSESLAEFVLFRNVVKVSQKSLPVLYTRSVGYRIRHTLRNDLKTRGSVGFCSDHSSVLHICLIIASHSLQYVRYTSSIDTLLSIYLMG